MPPARGLRDCDCDCENSEMLSTLISAPRHIAHVWRTLARRSPAGHTGAGRMRVG